MRVAKDQPIPTDPYTETQVFDGEIQDETRYWLGAVAEPGIVTHGDELRCAYILRANVYIGRRYLSEEERSQDGGECDPDDTRSHQLVVMEKVADGHARAIGTSRLIVKRDTGDALPIETFFPDVFVGHEAPAGSVEASRFIALHGDPRIQHAVSLILMLTMGVYAHIDSAHRIYATIEEPLARYFERVGISFERLAPKRQLGAYGNSENLPAVFKPLDVIDAIQNRTPNAIAISTFMGQCLCALGGAYRDRFMGNL